MELIYILSTLFLGYALLILSTIMADHIVKSKDHSPSYVGPFFVGVMGLVCWGFAMYRFIVWISG